jgi:hypothetical protein
LKIKNSKFSELFCPLSSNSNWTVSGKAGTGMSWPISEALKQYRINGGVKFIFDVGPTFKRFPQLAGITPLKPQFDPNPFNNVTRKMVDECLANCATHILLRSN